MENTGDNTTHDEPDHTSPGNANQGALQRNSLKDPPKLEQSQGEPRAALGDPLRQGNSGAEASTSGGKPIKGILKNRDMKSPINSAALNYSEPAESEVLRDNNYEEDNRFSKLVDSREIYAKKVKAGLVKRRPRNSSTESAPELSFYPKRQSRDDDDDKKDPKGSPRKPPVTV